jgi:cleavage stimulation factor subunit 2
LHQIFSEVGRVVNVRMVLDPETGKMRGFAFVEFEQAQDALAAIRNMNEYELNGRKLRVNFSNSSHLEVLAGKLGMDLSSSTGPSSATQPSAAAKPTGGLTGTNAVAESLKSFTKGEMYDVVAKFKEIADRDPDEARRLIAGHPQLPEALLFCMSKLDMIKTPLTSTMVEGAAVSGLGGLPVAPSTTAARAADPRAAVARVDPRQQARIDPRAPPRADPRAQLAPTPMSQLPPPPPPMHMAAPPGYAPPMGHGMAAPAPTGLNLDAAFMQQVLSLTPQQIAGLPPDKQQSILQLRQQITGQPM